MRSGAFLPRRQDRGPNCVDEKVCLRPSHRVAACGPHFMMLVATPAFDRPAIVDILDVSGVSYSPYAAASVCLSATFKLSPTWFPLLWIRSKPKASSSAPTKGQGEIEPKSVHANTGRSQPHRTHTQTHAKQSKEVEPMRGGGHGQKAQMQPHSTQRGGGWGVSLTGRQAHDRETTPGEVASMRGCMNKSERKGSQASVERVHRTTSFSQRLPLPLPLLLLLLLLLRRRLLLPLPQPLLLPLPLSLSLPLRRPLPPPQLPLPPLPLPLLLSLVTAASAAHAAYYCPLLPQLLRRVYWCDSF